MPVRTLGVEEEFLLVDPDTGRPCAVGGAVLAGADDPELTAELQREQVETATEPCRTLDELGAGLRSARAAAAAAAIEARAELAAVATSPLEVDPTLTPSPRYAEMRRRFGLTVSEELTCGCHVHVSIDSADEGVAVLDRIRPWLAPLLALSANSPFWQGADSGYRSFRSQVWQRWPSSGAYGLLGSAAGYRDLLRTMLDSDTLLDEGMVYFDARLARHHPTVEVRIADVCLAVDDAVLVAGLTRALVETAAAAWRAGAPPDPVPTEVLRLATWRAARSGVRTGLLDPRTWRPAPAADVFAALVAHVADALDEAGDRATVDELLAAVLARGTGADRQRSVYERTGDTAAVVRDVVRATTG